jgi:hypothetical protein
MTTLICAGGTGVRALEAVLHLCAAGVGPDRLRLLVIDPDAANGNGTRANELVKKYGNCRETFRPSGQALGRLPFFRTSLDLLETEGAEAGLKVWSPVGPNKRFADVVNFALLPNTAKDVIHLFFTDDELNMKTDVGFRGHPAIGAAAMSLLWLYRHQKPWSHLAEKIKTEVSETEGVRVVIVGSVFGGTGASAIHPLARFLRSMPETNRDRLKIGVVALVPYFQFRASAAAATPAEEGGARQLGAKSEYFALATRAAVQFYHHLRENRDWEFEAMYWLGDDSPVEVSYEVGGPGQKNPAHFVDLLAGLACLDFFAGDVTTKACQYAGPEECSDEGARNKNVVRWTDLPLLALDREQVQTRLLQFALTGAAHLGFFEPLFKKDRVDQKPYCIPWYLERFATKKDWLTTAEAEGPLTLLSEFFRDYHYPWWREIHTTEGERVRLLNRFALTARLHEGHQVDLRRLANLLYPDRASDASLDGVDRFFSDAVRVAKAGGGGGGATAYLTLLGEAAARFIQREYK